MPANQTDGRAQTVGAATAVLASMPLDPSRAGFVNGWAVGRDVGSGEMCAFQVAGAGRTNAANPPVVTAVGATGTLLSRADATLAGAACALGVVPGAVELRVTGVAGRTIQWTGEIQLFVSA